MEGRLRMKLKVKDFKKLVDDFGFEKKEIDGYVLCFQTKVTLVDNVEVSLFVHTDDKLLRVYVSNDYVWLKLKDYQYYNTDTEENELYFKQDQVNLMCNCDILIPDSIIELMLEMLEQGVVERLSD